MNIERFVNDRRSVWLELEALLDRAESADLSREETQTLVMLYRRACSDLNRVRAHTANPEILGYLNQLAGRGYRFVYQASYSETVRAAFARLITRDIPATFRRERNWVALAAAAFLLGTLFGAVAVAIDPANGDRLIPSMFATASPSERVADIESGEERIDRLEEALAFGASLYTHNIRVSFLAFSLGALTIVGGLWLLFYNGMILGAIAALYILDDVSLFFFAWVGPHGALELPAIIFGGAAGLLAGRAFLMPGNLTRNASLRRVLPSVWRMIIATALTLVLAGIIEGSISQFSARWVPYELKIAMALLLFTGLMTYLFARRSWAED
jgi:uncharacterized membrane protein SpoIIM required for sporulation